MINAWGSDPEKVAAVVNPKDAAAAYVPIARVSPRNLEEFANYIRSKSPKAQALTTKEIASTYRTQIERAYAALIMRLGDAEVIGRLEGR
jgi:hypothetical protein